MRPLNLILRTLILALLFTAELVVMTVAFDTADLSRVGYLLPILRDEGPWLLRSMVGFAFLFITFAFLKNRAALLSISNDVAKIPLRWGFLAGHLSTLAGLAVLAYFLFGSKLSSTVSDFLVLSLFSFGVTAIAFAALAFLPFQFWMRVVRSTGLLWVATALVIIAANFAGTESRYLWKSAAFLTFKLSKLFLSPFVSKIVSNLDTMELGTQKFSVIIDKACSGLEGTGLILAFGVIWLWLFRKENRFPQALLLIPAGMTVIFLMNAVRISALILIGDAGAPEIALGGFHSQAGWIFFNIVALSLAVVARRSSFFTKTATDRESRAASNPTAVFLLPFLAILAFGMISRAVSADFEWLYSLRFFAVAGVLWAFRREYKQLDWKSGWVGPGIGFIVFILWIALEQVLNPRSSVGMPPALASVGINTQFTWIALRALVAIVAVPIAEELAFRGYLMRRLISVDFESVSPKRFTWFALLATSLAFGLLHGDRWIAGALAGIIYGATVIRSGRIGEAVVAHAITNALLVAYILEFHQWQLW